MAKTKHTTSAGAPSLDFNNLESRMEAVFTKSLPLLPANAIEFIVKIAPWLAVIGVVLGIPAIINLGWGYQVSNILYIAQTVLTALAIQGLFARKLSAWRLMYYASWLSIFAGLLSGGIVSMLLGGLISFYLLFQVKKAYK